QTLVYTTETSLSNMADVVLVNSCKGYSPVDDVSMQRVFVNCGFFMTPPKYPTGAFTSMDGYFEQDIYLCSSTVRANVKQATFVYNNTAAEPNLNGLTVTQIERKNYSSEKEWPLWGVESPGEGWNISVLRPLWGLIAEDH